MVPPRGIIFERQASNKPAGLEELLATLTEVPSGVISDAVEEFAPGPEELDEAA